MDASLRFSIMLTFQVALLATCLVAVVGGVVAYILATRQFRGKILLEVIVTLPLILPPTVVGYYLILLFGRSGIIGSFIFRLTSWNIMFTWWACVLAAFIVSLPLMVKATEAAIKAVDQKMINTSYTLGYSELATIVKVVLPLAKNGIIAGIILSFARAMGEFGATLMLAGNIPGKTDTMPLTIYALVSSGEWGKVHLLVLILTLTSAIFLMLTYKLNKKRL